MKTLFTSDNLVRFKDGSVNVDASTDAFNAIVSKYVAQVDLQNETIAASVNAVFDRYPHAKIGIPFMIGQVLVALNVQPENSVELTKRVHAYISENADRPAVREKDANGKNIKGGKILVPAEPKRTRLFGIGRGKGSSCTRWSDVPVGDKRENIADEE